MPYFAVFVGRKPGIYTTWVQVLQNIKNFPNAKYVSYFTKMDAYKALKDYGITEVTNPDKINNSKIDTDMEIGKEIGKETSSIISLINKYYTMITSDISTGTGTGTGTELFIYTDGSVRNNGKKHAKGSYGVFYSDPRITPISQEIKRDTPITTPISELLGIINGLDKIKDYKYHGITLYTDSEYCYKSLTKWYPSWVKNGWKTAGKGTSVKNKDEIIEAKRLCDLLSVKLVHINSHTGKQGLHNIGNEIADMLTKCY